MLNRVSGRGAAIPDLELMEDRAQVRMYRPTAEKEGVGDLGVAHPACDQAKDLGLSRRQVFEPGSLRRIRLHQLRAGGRVFSPRGTHVLPQCLRRSRDGGGDFLAHTALQSPTAICIGKNAYFVCA